MKANFPVSSVLTHKSKALWSIAPEATVFEAIQMMAENNVGSLLVMRWGSLVGLVTERDYTRKVALEGRNSKETCVQEIIPEEVMTVPPDESVQECMRLMTESRVRHLPVLDEGRVVGIVSIGDLVNWIISAQDAHIEQMEQYIAGSVP